MAPGGLDLVYPVAVRGFGEPDELSDGQPWPTRAAKKRHQEGQYAGIEGIRVLVGELDGWCEKASSGESGEAIS